MVTERDWEIYFSQEGKTFFRKLLQVHRRVFISRAVRYWFNQVFPKAGIFVEAGAGTSESSGRVDPYDRKLIALDSCQYVLEHLNILPHKVQGDIRQMPFSPSSIDGIWNLGVMEHFNKEEIVRILREFHRILKPGCRILLFWPPTYAPYKVILGFVTRLAMTLLRKELLFFPEETLPYTARRQIEPLFREAGLEIEKTSFNWRDLYSYVVVIAKRPKSGLKNTFSRSHLKNA